MEQMPNSTSNINENLLDRSNFEKLIEKDTPEVASIKSRIEFWLTAHHNKLDLDLTKDPIEFKPFGNTIFNDHAPQVSISLGFKDEGITKSSSLDGVPSQWQIYPETPISSFSEGVTFEPYDSNTQILQLTVQTGFFAIYGEVPQEYRIACASARKGTYLQVRRDIQGLIKLRAKLVFN